MMLHSTIKFSWEKTPRTEKITQVTAGQSMQSEMEQTLSTLRAYDTYGIHFAFDKATIRGESATVLSDIAVTLKNNPSWTLQINGYTDSIGKPAYNQEALGKARGCSENCIGKTRHWSRPPANGWLWCGKAERRQCHPAGARFESARGTSAHR